MSNLFGFSFCTCNNRLQTVSSKKPSTTKQTSLQMSEYFDIFPKNFCKLSDVRNCRYLVVEKGADVNIPNHLGVTALYGAIQAPNIEILQFLIEKKSKVNVFCRKRISPLLLAVASKSLKMVNCLIDNGAGINIVKHSTIVTTLIA